MEICVADCRQVSRSQGLNILIEFTSPEVYLPWRSGAVRYYCIFLFLSSFKAKAQTILNSIFL